MLNECYATDTVEQPSGGISNLLSEETEKETVQRQVTALITITRPTQTSNTKSKSPTA